MRYQGSLGDIAISVFKMRMHSFFYCQKMKFLTGGLIEGLILRHTAKFHRNGTIRCLYITIFDILRWCVTPYCVLMRFVGPGLPIRVIVPNRQIGQTVAGISRSNGS